MMAFLRSEVPGMLPHHHVTECSPVTLPLSGGIVMSMLGTHHVDTAGLWFRQVSALGLLRALQ